MPVQDFLLEANDAPLDVALEPAHNAVYSLLLVAKGDHSSGLGQWVEHTMQDMSARELRRHQLVIMGFYHALVPSQSWPSFSAYVDHLATRDPRTLRDRMLEEYARLPCLDSGETQCLPAPADVDWPAVLRDVDSYLGFLQERFSPGQIDVELEAQAYSYVVDPPAMQDLIVSHLRHMWDEYLAAEWARVEPMLADSVQAFRQADLGRMDRREAVRWVTGQALEDSKWESLFQSAARIILVPSAHIGPYVGRIWAGETYWLLFGARLPKGSLVHAPDLSRTEILVRLSALADDTRLRILQQVAQEGELSSQEIMAGLGLSQSAASRHLTQLSATGYLSERRCSGAKCYVLDPARIEDTLQALSSFLLGTTGK